MQQIHREHILLRVLSTEVKLIKRKLTNRYFKLEININIISKIGQQDPTKTMFLINSRTVTPKENYPSALALKNQNV